MRGEYADGARGAAVEPGILRALVAAGNPVVGEGLRSVLASLRIEVAGLVGSCAEALARCAEVAPDLIFVEAQALAGAPTPEAATVDAPLIVLGVYDEPAAVRQAIDLGACAYLQRNLSLPCLRLAVEAARCGCVLIEGSCLPALTGQAAVPRKARPRPSPPREPQTLTARESEVLGLLARGLGYARVAEALSLSAATVRTHVRRICGKLGVRGRNEAVRWALARGWGRLPGAAPEG